MRFTPNKLRKLLLESNYRLPKGYDVVRRKRSLSGNMALSFLSGDAGSSIESLEARAKAMYARKKLLEAQDNLIEEIEFDELGFIGLDEIGNRKQARKEKRQEKKQARQEKREARKGGGSSPTEEPVVEDTPSTPATPVFKKSSGAKSLMPSLPAVQTRRADPIRSTKAAAPAPILRQDSSAANVSLETARQQVQQARDQAASAESDVAAKESPAGFFAGKNLLIIGGVAVAAIAGIFYFSRKK